VPFDGHDYPQIIPTPEHTEPGREPPWSHLPAESRRNITLASVVEALRATGRHFDVASPPSEVAELAVVDDDSERVITRRSAVLAALFEEDGEARVVLTRRSFDLRDHRGEVALPGGRLESGESAAEGAVREAEEEIGLDRRDLSVVGWLSPIMTFASGSAIQPIVGVLRARPELTANPAEVERIFDVALSDLLVEGNFLEQWWRRDVPRPGARPDGSFPIYFYRVPGEVIWGATGRILTELLSVVTGVPWPSPTWVVG